MQGQPARPDYDQALKWMLTRAPDGFLTLVAPDLMWRRDRSAEVPAVPRQADLAWEVERPDGTRGLLHVELQTKVEADIGERLAEYAIRLWRRDHLPVRSLVVFLREARTIPESPFVMRWDDQAGLRYDFGVVKLWEIPQERVLSMQGAILWPLASIMGGATVETTMAVAERIAAAPLPREDRSELTGLLGALAGLRMPREVIMDALRRNSRMGELLRESSLAELLMEEGEQKGKREMAQQMAHLALEGRFGTLSSDAFAALGQASEASLQALVAHISTDTWEQVRERLGLDKAQQGG